jgi:uncharacterized protein (DUF2267 family)
MQYDQFIGAVQDRAHLPSRGDAERAVQATFSCLGERLTAGAARTLGSQLPQMAAQHLDGARDEGRPAEVFDSQELIERVAAAQHVDPPQAAHHIRAVLEVTQAAVQGDTVAHVKEQLPDDFDRLFAGASGEMPSS